MSTLDIEQRSDAWFAARAGKFTGSRFSSLMARLKNGEPGASCQNLLAALVIERLTGRPTEMYVNAAMERGTLLEPHALTAYTERTGNAVKTVGFVVHHWLDYVGVSPDGLIGEDGLVEIKCPSAENKHLDALLHANHAAEYKWQIQGQMWVTGRQWCDAVSYHPGWPDHMTLAITRVHRDAAMQQALMESCIWGNDQILKSIAALTEKFPDPRDEVAF